MGGTMHSVYPITPWSIQLPLLMLQDVKTPSQSPAGVTGGLQLQSDAHPVSDQPH